LLSVQFAHGKAVQINYGQSRSNLGENDYFRVVGGTPTQIEDFPFTVILTYRETAILFCGGALISDRYVLTAAHCIMNKLAADIVVRLGVTDWSEMEDSIHHAIPAVEVFSHPKFSYLTTHYDIGLVKLERSAPTTPKVSPICLPDPSSFADESAVIVGWGATSVDGFPINFLHKLSLKVLSNEDCKKRLDNRSIFLNKNKLCAWAEKKDSCRGDSGGPLVWEDSKPQEKRKLLIGISSSGFKCGLTNLPGIYTRVSSYLDWIKEVTNDDPNLCMA